MANFDRKTYLSRNFSDPRNYPYGFARSGDFSIAESRALSHYGCLFQALSNGDIQPETPDDNAFMQVLSDNTAAQSIEHKAWIKYQQRIHRQKQGSIYGAKKVEQTEPDEESEADESMDIDD